MMSFNFTAFYLEAAWTRLYLEPGQAISNKISVQLHETNPPTFPPLASSMSKSTALTKPQTHTSLSNKTVDFTTTLIALMHQSLQQNSIIIAQLYSHTSPQPLKQPSLSYQFRPQRPPFPKWDGTPPTTPLLIYQISTDKAEAFYAGVHDWT